MKEHYDFIEARPNPYAAKMKNGYSVAIHYETQEDLEKESTMDTIKSILIQPGLNSLHLYIKNPENKEVVT